MSTTRIVTCIVCPEGCKVSVSMEGDTITGVSGHGCRRGLAYARQEAVAPMRTLTTSVRVSGGVLPLVSVKTSAPVPRERLHDIMACVRTCCVSAPVRQGEVVLANVLELGVDVVATRSVERGLPAAVPELRHRKQQ